MLRGVYTAASNMIYKNQVHANISANLANSATTAFCSSDVVLRSRQETPQRRQMDSAVKKTQPKVYGVQRTGVYTNFTTSGPRQVTGDPMHLALTNIPNAFFAVRGGTPDKPQTHYTKNGLLSVQVEEGKPGSAPVLHMGGHVVLNEQNQPIEVDASAGALVIRQDGEIMQSGSSIGRIPVFRMNKGDNPLDQRNANLQLLDKREDGLYSIRLGVKKEEIYAMPMVVDQNSQLMRQGELNGSNVDTMSQMVSMIQANRSVGASQGLIHLATEGLWKLFQLVAKA